MVGTYWTFHPGWYVVIGIPFSIWAFISIYRKSYKKSEELRQQLIMGFIGFGLGVLAESLAVNMGLWHYGGGDWPIILWPTYFFCAISGYQIVKMLGKLIK